MRKGAGHAGRGNIGMGSGARSINSPGNTGAPKSIVALEAPHNEQEEEAYLREAIKASLSEQEQQMTTANAKFNGHGQSSARIINCLAKGTR